MKVIVAKTAGFCWGVRRAMDAVLEASLGKEKVQTLGPLIHNPQALELLERRGVTVADRPSALQKGTVVVRAHGIPIQQLRDLKERQKQGELKLVNATCPEVAKVHSRIKKWSPKGYFTVILGTHGHAESTAHQSFAEHGAIIVSSMAEAEALTPQQVEKVLVVAQTTFTVKDFREISQYIQSRSTQCIVENTICEDTWQRQAESKALAQAVDYVVVVGGKTSSNTKHLAELAGHYGKPVQYVETASELDLSRFKGTGTVGVLAGASTPTWLVEEVVDVLEQMGSASTRAARLCRSLYAAFKNPVRLAVGSVFLAKGIRHWIELSSMWQYPLITGTYILGMYLLAPYMDPLGLGSKGPARARLLERHRTLNIVVACTSLAVAIAAAASVSFGAVVVVGGASIAGLFYRRRLKVGRWSLSLQAIPGSKDLVVSLALAVVAMALPLWHADRIWDLSVWSAILLLSALVFARTTIYNIRDMQNDQIMGRETLPTLIGRRASKAVLVAILGVALVASLAANLLLRPPPHPVLEGLVITAVCAYPVLYIWLIHERFSVGKGRMEPWVELNFFVAGLLSLL